MQKSYELIMDKKLDKRNFRKKVLTAEGLRELNEFSKTKSKRPARLYTFDSIKLNSKRAHFISKPKVLEAKSEIKPEIKVEKPKAAKSKKEKVKIK